MFCLQKDSLQTTTSDKMTSTQAMPDEHLEKRIDYISNRN